MVVTISSWRSMQRMQLLSLSLTYSLLPSAASPASRDVCARAQLGRRKLKKRRG
jgi:hypothetical protein